MKKTLLIIGAIAAVAYVIISAFKGNLKFWEWFASTPPDTIHPAGTGCTTNDNRQGIYDANGICVATGGAPPANDAVIRTARKVKCYLKPAGTSCNPRIYDSVLGWGTLYSQTSTTCCYIF